MTTRQTVCRWDYQKIYETSSVYVKEKTTILPQTDVDRSRQNRAKDQRVNARFAEQKISSEHTRVLCE